MTTTKKSQAKKPTAKASTSASTIDKVAKDVLKKLQSLHIEEKLQADIEWCLGSYSFDKNPAGLKEMLDKSSHVLHQALEKNPKAVTAKLLKEVEAAIKK